MAAHGEVVECTGRCLDSVGVDSYAASFGDDDGVGSDTLGCAGNGAEVAHIGDAVEHDDDGQDAFFVELWHDVVKVVVGDCGKLCHYALVILACDAINALHWHSLVDDVVGAYEVKKFVGEVALEVFFDEYAVDLFTCFDGFDNGSDAEDVFVAFHCCEYCILSSERALAMAAGSTALPLSITAISSMRCSRVRWLMLVVVDVSLSCLYTLKWVVPRAATWGRWVIAITCSDCAIWLIMLPMRWAMSPDTPVSISSKMIDGSCMWAAMIDLMVSISREISPPDAVACTGMGCWFLLKAKRNCMVSMPVGVSWVVGVNCMSHCKFFMPRGEARAMSCCENSSACLRRRLDISRATSRACF